MPVGPGRRASSNCANPELDFVSLARGMGVPATRATTAEELASQLADRAPGVRSTPDRGHAARQDWDDVGVGWRLPKRTSPVTLAAGPSVATHSCHGGLLRRANANVDD